MITLDLFGSWGNLFIEELNNCSEEHSVLYLLMKDIRIEKPKEIPEDYYNKEFAGRISFYEADTDSVVECFYDTNYETSGNNGYLVVGGYFPRDIFSRGRESPLQVGEDDITDEDARMLEEYFGYEGEH
jgi:hypothetical protein